MSSPMAPKPIAIGVLSISAIVGVILAFYISTHEKYKENLNLLDAIGLKDAFIAAAFAVPLYYIFHSVVSKYGSITRKACSVGRPDQHVYALMTEADDDSTGPSGQRVRMVQSGEEGRWNRAQRGLYNWTESRELDVACALLLCFPMGYLALILVAVQGIGRVMFTKGYVEGTAGRVPGFVVSFLGSAIGFIMLLCYAVGGLV